MEGSSANHQFKSRPPFLSRVYSRLCYYLGSKRSSYLHSSVKLRLDYTPATRACICYQRSSGYRHLWTRARDFGAAGTDGPSWRGALPVLSAQLCAVSAHIPEHNSYCHALLPTHLLGSRHLNHANSTLCILL
jgi:hypothetical protein